MLPLLMFEAIRLYVVMPLSAVVLPRFSVPYIPFKHSATYAGLLSTYLYRFIRPISILSVHEAHHEAACLLY
ncbi:hypothetical protein EI42_06440 [Thermosporothrix hazakensis]|jgi:hypothetical protein|uniref:Uncharacterized protein n=1 Tax=Thermosporothrix hazakensis TaxID=644383 RepID=A0A326TQ57_THEHA|nr:hypothetical protein EI42_06440 [Thermosporothrix hazakensis]